MNTFEKGMLYEFTMAEGSTLTLRYDGRNAQFQDTWFEPGTGATMHQLPPYAAVKLNGRSK